MELYILDNNNLSILSVLECSSYEINLDNQFTDKSVFRVNKAAGQIKDNFLVVNGLYQQFLFIIDEVEATDKEEKFVNLVCSDISNIFNRKIIQQDIDLMTTRSIEYFLAHTIDVNFINSDDSFLNKSYIEVTYTEHTQAKEATNAENGIYNFHTFMENCREHHNVFTDFKFEDGKLKITIAYKNDSAVIIDTTLPEVTHYNKVYEQDITAKVQVYIRENDTIQNYYLKTDRTITTDKNDPDRAAGAIEVISVETEDDALQEATNVFKGNTYKHLVEFSMSKNSKLVDTTTLYICRAIRIKTPDGIYDSIISGISLDDDNYINYKSGNIRINFIDKLKQEQENYGNKLDVTGGVIKGDLTTEGNITTGTLISNGNATINGTITSDNSIVDEQIQAKFFTPQFYELDLESLSINNFYPITFPKPGYDYTLDCEIHSPNLRGTEPYNQNTIHFVSLAGGWADTPAYLNILNFGRFDTSEIAIGCIAQNDGVDPGPKWETECVWLRGGLKYRFVSNFKPVLHTTDYIAGGVKYAVGGQYYGGNNTTASVKFYPDSVTGGRVSVIGNELVYNGNNMQKLILPSSNGDIGFRCLCSFTASAWNNYRMTLLIQSRHQGTGILSIGISTGANSTTTNGYPSINYFGTTCQSTTPNWYLFFNYSTGLISLYWRHSDYSETKITVLANNGFPRLSLGSFVSSIPSSAGNLFPMTFGVSPYKDEERVIGSWYNDKPIYRKVIVSTTFASQYTIATGVDELVKITGVAYRKDYNVAQVIPSRIGESTQLDFGNFDFAGGYIIVRWGSYWSGAPSTNFKKIIIIAEYTKTTNTQN